MAILPKSQLVARYSQAYSACVMSPITHCVMKTAVTGLINPFKPEFTIVIFIHYKPRIAVAILDL